MKKRIGSAIWTVCIANFLLVMAINAFYPIWSVWDAPQNQPLHNAASLAFYVIGLFLPGSLNAFLMEKYRRQRVCLKAHLLLLAVIFLYYSVEHTWMMLCFIRMMQGVAVALIQMSLGTTILNDLSDSGGRTTVDVLYGWLGRLGIPLGFVLGNVCFSRSGGETACLVAAALCLLSFVLIFYVKVPFKAPIDVKTFSLDRFWLPQGKWIFLDLLLVSFTFGILISKAKHPEEYAVTALGIFLAWIAQRYAFGSADRRAEIVCGGILTMAACFMLNEHVSRNYIAYVLLGLGFGLSTARFLLYFLKMSKHCQRGTAQHTYFLGCEMGICLGFALGFLTERFLLIGILLQIVALVLYLFIMDPDFVKYGDRSFRIRKL